MKRQKKKSNLELLEEKIEHFKLDMAYILNSIAHISWLAHNVRAPKMLQKDLEELIVIDETLETANDELQHFLWRFWGGNVIESLESKGLLDDLNDTPAFNDEGSIKSLP